MLIHCIFLIKLQQALTRYVVVVKDAYSGFVKLYPVQKIDADTVSGRLEDHIQGIGKPRKLITDNGKEYCNQKVKELTESYGIEHETTPPLASISNGMVERANRSVNEVLRVLLIEKGVHARQWPTLIRAVEERLNSAASVPLAGYAPYEVQFGERVPVEGTLPEQPERLSKADIEKMHEAVRKAREKSKQTHKDHHNRSKAIKPTDFDAEDYVWVFRPTGTKLDARYVGPAKVEAKLGPLRYRIRFPKELGGDSYQRHAIHLKKFWGPDLVLSAKLIRAAQNIMGSRRLEEIRAKIASTERMEYEVKFSGSSETEVVTENSLKQFYGEELRSFEESSNVRHDLRASWGGVS